MKKFVFFFRAYNDLDNLVPIIYALLFREKTVSVVYTTCDRLRSDFRLSFLRSLFSFQEVVLEDFRGSKLVGLIESKNNRTEFKKRLKYIFKGECPNNTFESDKKLAQKVFDNLEDQGSEQVVCFDWTTSSFAREYCRIAKEKGYKSFALPHGASPYVNRLQTRYQLDFSYPAVQMTDIFDHIVIPSTVNAKIDYPLVSNDKVKLLGSARYCAEWVRIYKDKLLSKFSWKENAKLRIVLFLRCTQYAIHFEELYRTIRIICSYKEVQLVVKYHTRLTSLSVNKMNFQDFLGSFENLYVAYDDVSSSSLIEWGDLMINLGTSAINEIVWMNKPVLSPDYLHPNTTTTAHFFPKSELKTRDDLRHSIERMISSKENFTYNDKEKNQFISEMINPNSVDVLEQYCQVLEN